jgi:hypothetical protein
MVAASSSAYIPPASVTKQCLEGLSYIQGAVHLDVKPGNMFIVRRSNRRSLSLLQKRMPTRASCAGIGLRLLLASAASSRGRGNNCTTCQIRDSPDRTHHQASPRHQAHSHTKGNRNIDAGEQNICRQGGGGVLPPGNGNQSPSVLWSATICSLSISVGMECYDMLCYDMLLTCLIRVGKCACHPRAALHCYPPLHAHYCKADEG